MQQFERWFAIWPDGGNGQLEADVATAVAVLAVAARRPLARAVRRLLARCAAALTRRP